MNLNATALAYIQNVVKTAKTLKIDNVIIEPGKVRAMDSDQSVVIFVNENVPSLPFGSIGINRLTVFASRFDLARNTPNFQIEIGTTMGDNPNVGYDKFDVKDKNKPGIKQPMWVKSLTFTGLNMSIDYRCANPSILTAPKVRDDVDLYRLRMTSQAFDLIQKGKVAMDSDYVTFKGNSKGVTIAVTDDNGDTMKYKMATPIVPLTDNPISDFEISYPIEKLIPLFKSDETDFHISKKGFLVASLNDLDIYVSPTTKV